MILRAFENSEVYMLVYCLRIIYRNYSLAVEFVYVEIRQFFGLKELINLKVSKNQKINQLTYSQIHY